MHSDSVTYMPKTFAEDTRSNTAPQKKLLDSEQVAAGCRTQMTRTQEKEWFQSSGLASLLGL